MHASRLSPLAGLGRAKPGAQWPQGQAVRPADVGQPAVGWVALGLAAGCLAAFGSPLPNPGPAGGMVQVVAVAGTATYQVSTNPPLPVRPGAKLPEGLVIRTGPGSALDLSLGKRAGVVRLAENTALLLEQLHQEPAGGTGPVQLRLYLLEGTLLGLRNNVSLTDRFEIKIPSGIAGIAASLFRIEARGYLVVLSGRVLFAHAPPGAEPVVHRLEAPPAVYFSPLEGVRPAPAELEREVRAQCRPRLRSSATGWGERRPVGLEPPGTPRLGPWPHARSSHKPTAFGMAWAGHAGQWPGFWNQRRFGGRAEPDWLAVMR